ncbi:monocarboxylate transporter 10 isoform X1 [Schistocerca gregaria]|uniref:monocarboxylate transporter 10 isoform X1 n=1 Tax=Schistocerca gregaria TaxID=7010 RepID=UPI00211DFF17|nr:monocarboxylate transporter 10 isoform X1 [Schistocerca gregaria]
MAAREQLQVEAQEQPQHVDAGAGECSRPRPLFIVAASFLCNGIIFGVINSYSVFYVQLLAKLERNGVSEASSKASLVGALAMGTTFILSPVAGVLTDRFGIRLTTFVGGALASGGMFLSSLVEPIELLCFTYGIMFGTGASLVYTPSLVILGHYFKKYMGIVNGFVTAGSSVFTIVMPFVIEGLLTAVSMESCMQFLAGLMALMMLCAVLFKPVKPASDASNDVKTGFKSLLNVDIWKKKKYVIWAIAVPSALFGYFVPYIHMLKFVQDSFPQEDGKLLIMCLGATSGLGRLIFGKIADIPKVNRIFLQQISFVAIGCLTMLLPIVNKFGILVVIALCMGLFDGCFISLLGPIAFEICGHKGAPQAIGFLLGMCSVPLTVGPPVAGIIYDHTKSYTIPFLLAGVPPIVGGIALYLVQCVTDDDDEDRAMSEAKSLQVMDTPAAVEDNKLGVITNCNSPSHPLTLENGTGMWVDIIAARITPHYKPECERLIIEPVKSCPQICVGEQKLRRYSYSVL